MVVFVVERRKACVWRAEGIGIVDAPTGFAWQTVIERRVGRVDACGRVVDFG